MHGNCKGWLGKMQFLYVQGNTILSRARKLQKINITLHDALCQTGIAQYNFRNMPNRYELSTIDIPKFPMILDNMK
jgi:hypothetical protein